MHLYNKKDEENGCWVFYEPKGMKVPKRTGTNVDPKSEVACEKLDSGNMFCAMISLFSNYIILWTFK